MAVRNPNTNGADSRSWSERVTATLLHLDRLRQPTSLRGKVLAGLSALLLFAFVVFLAARSLPTLTDPNPWLVLLLVLVATPLIALLNALEFRIIGRSVGQEYTLTESARVTLLGSIANFLPAPGSFVVRTGSLSKRGVDLRSATSSNVLAAALWLGTTAVVAGLALLWGGAVLVALAGFAAGAALVGGATFRLVRMSSSAVARDLAIVELAMVLISAIRTWLAFRTLGEAVSVHDAVIIGTSQVIASIVGIAPAGLGVREIVAGALGATVGIDPALTVTATAVDRAASQVGFLVIGVVFVAAGKLSGNDLLARIRIRSSQSSSSGGTESGATPPPTGD